MTYGGYLRSEARESVISMRAACARVRGVSVAAAVACVQAVRCLQCFAGWHGSDAQADEGIMQLRVCIAVWGACLQCGALVAVRGSGCASRWRRASGSARAATPAPRPPAPPMGPRRRAFARVPAEVFTIALLHHDRRMPSFVCECMNHE